MPSLIASTSFTHKVLTSSYKNNDIVVYVSGTLIIFIPHLVIVLPIEGVQNRGKLGEVSRRGRRHYRRPQLMLDEQAGGVESGRYPLRQLKHQPTHVVDMALFERRQEIVRGVSFLYAELIALRPKARDLENKAGSMIDTYITMELV